MKEKELNINPENYNEYKNYYDKMIELDLQSFKKYALKLSLSFPFVVIALFTAISTLLNINFMLFNIIGTIITTSCLYTIDFGIFLHKLKKNKLNLMDKYQNINTEYDIFEIEEALNKLVMTNILEYQTKKYEKMRKEMIEPAVREYKAINYTNEFLTSELPKVKVKGRTYPRR